MQPVVVNDFAAYGNERDCKLMTTNDISDGRNSSTTSKIQMATHLSNSFCKGDGPDGVFISLIGHYPEVSLEPAWNNRTVHFAAREMTTK